MRMSCNGCRVLRKGCGENCSIRPCLQWIKNPDSQANATVFLAKFYGRAGLMNLIHAGPDHLRAGILYYYSPSIFFSSIPFSFFFRVLTICSLHPLAPLFLSLLYEACGRIVSPIYGSAGLLWSGRWQLCQAAVDSVLNGVPILPSPSEFAVSNPASPFKASDIRHLTRETRGAAAAAETKLSKISKCRTRFKHAASAATTSPSSQWCCPAYFRPSGSRDSSGFPPENESMCSLEASHVSQGESKHFDPAEVALELTLGYDLDTAGRRTGDSSSDRQLCDTTFPAADVRLQL
ncbi:LOB domain-containing protein 41 [Platanthera zijinensis]|uniref:LOB domain-containing protein 41 n=1 Tax=Platanthera zijinensis TaxID=2320716 RepID=A0AAP0BP46_9ASPA